MGQIGAHVRDADPVAAAGEVGADVVQFFLADPQGWKKPQPREDADAVRASGLGVYAHAPYLVNVASTNNKIRICRRCRHRIRCATPRRRSRTYRSLPTGKASAPGVVWGWTARSGARDGPCASDGWFGCAPPRLLRDVGPSLGVVDHAGDVGDQRGGVIGRAYDAIRI